MNFTDEKFQEAGYRFYPRKDQYHKGVWQKRVPDKDGKASYFIEANVYFLQGEKQVEFQTHIFFPPLRGKRERICVVSLSDKDYNTIQEVEEEYTRIFTLLGGIPDQFNN